MSLRFTRWDLLTGWAPLVVVLGGLLIAGALLARPERLGPGVLALTSACTTILLLGLWVLVVGWL